ncbi:MAG TPA: hypothetical protein VGQ59_16150 [Cyclobacteriaceae bacterium]|nr:hypothetical protein [Cyclobacteriaceae bacterium]
MKQIVIYFLVVFGLCLPGVLAAQTQDSYDYNSEFTMGVNKNSYGGFIGGFVFKKARRIDKKVFETFGLEVMNVKNPHEVRTQAPSSGNYFIYGKSNYLYALRFQYGRDLVLFTKGPQQGVEVKAVFAVGPSIGVVAPYYVQVDPTGGQGYYTYNVPYTPDITYGQIQGTGSLFEGLFESTLKIGGNLKAAMNFELGTAKNQVTGFEVGFLLDAYTSKIVLMPSTENQAVFPTVFLTLFWGSRK